MRPPSPEAIVVDGQWIEIAKAEPHDPSAELLRLADIAKLPFAQDAALPHPDTGTALPVPFGSLAAYAQHLANQWGDDTIAVRILFQRSLDKLMTLKEIMVETLGTHFTDEELQKAVETGQVYLFGQDGTVSLPPHITIQHKPASEQGE